MSIVIPAADQAAFRAALIKIGDDVIRAELGTGWGEELVESVFGKVADKVMEHYGAPLTGGQ